MAIPHIFIIYIYRDGCAYVDTLTGVVYITRCTDSAKDMINVCYTLICVCVCVWRRAHGFVMKRVINVSSLAE